MEPALKIAGLITGLFVIINGIYVFFMPPLGDESQGLAIIALGIFTLILAWWIGGIEDRLRGTG